MSHLANVEDKDNLWCRSLSEVVFLLFTAMFSRLTGLLAPGDLPVSTPTPPSLTRNTGILNTCYHFSFAWVLGYHMPPCMPITPHIEPSPQLLNEKLLRVQIDNT